MQISSRDRITLLLLLFFLQSNIAVADTGLISNLQYHGFLTQGFTYTTDNNFFGESSDNGSFEFTEIGFNLSGRVLDNTYASAQVISRTAGVFDDGDLKLDYGMLDFNLVNREHWLGGLRLGRVKNPYGLYNDGRDAAVSRNGIFLPQSIYFDKVRDLIHHSDGFMVYADVNLNNADLYFQSAYGRSDMGVNVENAFLANDFPGEMEDDDPISSTRLIYEYEGGLFRLGYTKVYLNMAYRPAAAFPLDIGPGGVDMDLDIFSVEFNQDKWSITAEYMQQDIAWYNFSIPSLDNNDHTAEGYYLQATYRPLDTTEFFIRYDVSHLNVDDKDGSLSASRPPPPVPPPAFAQYAHDWTLGMRWDVTKNFMLRAEYHNIEGTSWLSAQEIPFSSMVKDWDMFNLLVSYHF